MLIASIKNKLKRHYRHGVRFKRHYERFANAQSLTLAQLRPLQEKELQALIEYCYKNVPFYQALFKSLNIEPQDIKTLDDLKRLPIIDKFDIKSQPEKFKAETFCSFLNRGAYTSGTTGTPVKFLRDYNSISFENAAVWHYWRQSGDNTRRRITLRGEIVKPAEQQTPPFWSYNAENQELLMSSYHLSLEHIDHYIEKIMAFKPEILYCYPSTGALLARLFLEKGISYRFHAIFTSSESLAQEHLNLMENTFQARVFDWYGQVERVAGIFRCASGNYHIHESYSLVELLPSSENPGLYEIIGTNLNNYAMPLLRYRTHDLVEMENENYTCGCGSHFRVVRRLIGRKPNYIVTPEGNLIGNAPSNILKGIEGIMEAQFHQNAQETLKLLVVPAENYSEKVRQKLIDRTRQYTSQTLKVEIVEVDRIERGPNGKFTSLVSTITSTSGRE